jgi:hypothetical protein
MAEDAQGADDGRAAIWAERWQVVHRLRLSALYHQKRERFFDTLDRCIKAFAVVGGAAAVSQLVAATETKLWIAAAVSVSSAVSLVFALAPKARRHGELARDFTKLFARVEEAGPFPPPETLDKFRSETLMLEASEPAAMSALVRHCENELCMSIGQNEQVIPLTLLQSVFMHLWDFNFEHQPSPARKEDPGEPPPAGN